MVFFSAAAVVGASRCPPKDVHRCGAAMTARERLIAKIESQKARPGDAVVSLDDFFVGNSDRGSIGCNLGKDQPALSVFYDTLRAIRAMREVQDVLVRICEYDAPDAWPYSDTVYILTSAALEDVQQWLAPLKPDEVYAGWMYGAPPKAPQLGAGMTPYSVWWD
jgi:hypothetical protein